MWRRYLRFWRSDIPRDVDDELRFHVEMRVAEYVARGMSQDDARRAVLARLGDLDAARTECIALGEVRERNARQAGLLEGVRADVGYALRSLRRTPGWTAVALLTIALGVGATTAVFRVADTLIVRPIPYPDASRVYFAQRQFTVDGNTIPSRVPTEIVPIWRRDARSVEAVAPVFGGVSRPYGDARDGVTVFAARIDTSFLAFAGVRPLIGRNFSAEEMAPGGPPAMLLGEQFWRRHHGGSFDVLGKSVEIEGRAHTIVGVVPASVTIPDFRSTRADVLLPISLVRSGSSILVRLRPGISPAVARDELDALLERAKVFDVKPVPMPMPLHLTRPQDWLAVREPVLMLTGAVALLLLVACTNIAHLLLARGAARQRELAVRHAMGAGRSRLVRQLVTESVLLAAIGGVLAVFVGWSGLRILAAIRPESLVALTHVSADRGVLYLASTLAIASGIGVGLFAAMRTARRDLAVSLRAGAWSTMLGGRRLRGALVIGEVSLSATLLVGALLLIHAVYTLHRTHLGFDERGLYVVTFPRPENEPKARRDVFEALLRERLQRVPGVEGFTTGSAALSVRHWRLLVAFETPEREVAPENASTSVSVNYVTPEYFTLLRMPLLAGRSFDPGSHARHEVIVSRSVARQLSADGDVVGKRIRNAVPRSRGVVEPWQTVIGVVPDVVTNLAEPNDGLGLYHPVEALNTRGELGDVSVIVRMSGADPAARLREVARSVQPGDARIRIQNVRDEILRSVAEPRFTMRVLVVFASLAVVLAAIGLYGVISYGVRQRTREIGVRMTLGATRASVARLVVGEGLRLACAGIVVGLAGAAFASRLIHSMLFGVSPLDPFSFGLGALVLIAIAGGACIVPMLRATGVDPTIAVRAE